VRLTLIAAATLTGGGLCPALTGDGPMHFYSNGRRSSVGALPGGNLASMAQRRIKSVACWLLLNRVVGGALRRLKHDRFAVLGACIVTTPRHVVSAEVCAALAFQAYEKAELTLAQSFLIPDLDAIELGGALGVTGSVILRKLRPPARLITLEFRPELLPILERNLSLNSCGNMFDVLPRAIAYPQDADRDIRADFVIPAGSFGSLKSYKHALGFRTISAPIITLREICEEFSLDSFQLICDIEGAELELIEQDRAVLEKCRLLIIELHEANRPARSVSPVQIRDLLLDQGFRVLAANGNVLALTR
jgi:FkbM family methyltransferase